MKSDWLKSVQLGRKLRARRTARQWLRAALGQPIWTPKMHRIAKKRVREAIKRGRGARRPLP